MIMVSYKSLLGDKHHYVCVYSPVLLLGLTDHQHHSFSVVGPTFVKIQEDRTLSIQNHKTTTRQYVCPLRRPQAPELYGLGSDGFDLAADFGFR